MKLIHKAFYFVEIDADNIIVSRHHFIHGALPIIWCRQGVYGYIPVEFIKDRITRLVVGAKVGSSETMISWEMTIPILDTIAELFKYAER